MTFNDRILGVCALLFAAFLAWQGWDMHSAFSYEPVGPRAFPLLLALVIALCGLWLVLRGRDVAAPNPPGANRRIAAMVGMVVVYAAVFDWLGFVIATTAMCLGVGRLFGGSWKQCAIGGVSTGILFFLLFDKVFDVVLPKGALGF